MAASVQSICDQWKNFDLVQLQRELDTEATELANRQDESDQSRKRLIELNREFKKNTPEDVRKAVVPVLKSFQAEVDALSKRSKAAEAAFLLLFKKMIDLPDPVAALEHAHALQKKAQRVQDLELENKKLRDTLHEYNTEFAEVKNQEVTIKALRERAREAESRAEEAVLARCDTRVREVEAQWQEKERHLQEAQLQVATRLGDSEHRLSLLQTALDQSHSELFDLKAKYDEDMQAKSDELDMVGNDLDRTNQKSADLEKEVSKLEAELSIVRRCQQQAVAGSTAVSGEGSAAVTTQVLDEAMLAARASMEGEIQGKDNQISDLVAEVRQLQREVRAVRESHTRDTTQLEEELTARNTELRELQERMGAQSDYQDIKRELTILKSLEFHNDPAAAAVVSTTPAAAAASDPAAATATASPSSATAAAAVTSPVTAAAAMVTPKTLEALLLEKNRGLQNDNTSLKVSNAELSAKCDKLESDYSEAVRTVTEQRKLVSQLEADLLAMQSLSSAYRGQGEGSPATPSSGGEAAAAVANVVKDVVTGTMSPTQPYPVTGSSDTTESSLLPIITSQRERFRQRNQQLETQSVQQQSTIHMLQNEVDRMRSDNVKLYEKIKFLHSYPHKSGVGYGAAAGSSRSSAGDVEVESRYSSHYEENLDPFQSFNRKERMRRYMNLSPHEKITLSMGQFIMSSKLGRMFAFFYTLFLHLLVFGVLYKLAHTESCKVEVAAECAQRFSEHMHSVHGERSPFEPPPN